MVSEDPARLRFPAGFPAWGSSTHPPSDCHCRHWATSTVWIRPGFPANSQLHSPTSPSGGAAPRLHSPGILYLRTVIVLHRLPHIAMGHGPSLHPSASKRELSVWPLRIPIPQQLDDLVIGPSSLSASVHRGSQLQDLLDSIGATMTT
jgi:hypothetical protein